MTQVGPIHCISIDELERALLHGGLTDGIRSHLEKCDYCREQEVMVRENLEFMGGVVGKLGAEGLSMPPRAVMEPRVLPGYELVREIARGGQGVVYEALQIETKRRVAIKLIEVGDEDGRTRRRVEREAELAASLRHPNIVSLYQRTVLADGRQALAMEYVEGVAIDEWARAVDAASPLGKEAGRTALRVKLRAVSTVCDALQHAHVNGVIHRDLKPANVLVTNSGIPRVVDFGIARRVASESRITRTGAFAGTLAYASPEQVSGQPGTVDIRSDVYALGLILYEVLSGRRPYDTATSLSGAIANITRARPDPLGAIQPGDQPAGEELESIVEKALAKDRSERYQSAAALKGDIDNWLAGRPVEARHHSTVYLLKKLAMRHRLAVFATAGVILLLAAFAGVMAWSSGRLAMQKSLLAASLSSSTIERGRLMGLNGENGRAEAMIWPELARTGVDPGAPNLFFDSPPDVMQPVWALFELYSRHPMLRHIPVAAGSEAMRFEDGGTTIRVLRPGGAQDVYSIERGGLVSSVPGSLSGDAGGMFVDSTRRRGLFSFEDHTALVDADAHTNVTWRGNGPTDKVFDCSPDASRLLTVGAGGVLKLWRAAPAELIQELATGMAAQARPRFTLDGKFVAAGVGDRVRLWRADDGSLAREWPIPPDLYSSAVRAAVTTVQLSPDGRQVAAGFHSQLLLYPMEGGGDVRQVAAHRGFVGWIEYSRDGSVLLTSGSERNCRTWDPTTGQLLCSIEQVIPNRGVATISDDGSLVAFCDTRDALRVFETRPRRWLTRLTGPENTVHTVRFSPSGDSLAAVSSDGLLRVWNPADGTLRWSLAPEGGNGPLEAMTYSKDGDRIFVAGQGGDIREVEVLEHRSMRTLVKGADRITWLGCSPNGRILAAAGGTATIDLYDATTGSPLRSLQGHSLRAIECVFSADSETLYSVGAEGVCIGWDIKTGRERFRTESAGASMRAICLSPDGSTVVSGCDDWIIRMFDARNGKLIRSINGAKQHVFGLAFHPKGNILFSCNRDSMVQVWDVRTGRELAVLDGHANLVLSLAVSPDGMTLATGSSDRSVGVWDLGYYRRHVAGNASQWKDKAPVMTSVEPR